MDRRQFTFAASAASLIGLPGLALADDVLNGIVAGSHRKPEDRARDPHRHPAETLAFFGLRPGMTVVEIAPSSYYFDILAPYAKATGGKYVVTGANTPYATQLQNAALYGEPTFTGAFGATSGALVPAGTADLILTFRNVHNWMWRPDGAEKAFRDFAAALKPGGVLGVVEHRADPRPETVQGARRASDGYVAKASVLAFAEAAGLRLDGESEVNANPRDTKDHPGGVWMLPPNLRAPNPRPDDYSPARYQQIGESDRMTLRFVKA